MPVQLVVCDMDGTLFLKDELMPEFSSEFSKQLMEKGIKFAVATGRSLPLSKKFVDILKPTAPCVYANGALIASPEWTIASYKLPLAPLRQILEDAAADGMSVMINWDTNEEFVLKHTEWTLRQRALFGIYQREYVPTEEEWQTAGAYKIMIKDPLHRIQMVCDRLAELSTYCTYVQYETGATEIMAKNLNKAKGVLQLAEALHIPPSDVAAIGDYYNDIEMMSVVGHSAAVGNAIDAVKSRAKYVCSQPYAFGVKEVIDLLTQN